MGTDKIKGSVAAHSSLRATGEAPHLDEAAKEIFTNKEFLALLLRYTVAEYAGMDLAAIAACIETDSVGREVELAPVGANVNRITGDNTELAVMGEMLAKFDVRFRARNPKRSDEKTTCFLHINVEPQNEYKPGYPIEKRGVYYMARMVSVQLPTPPSSALPRKAEAAGGGGYNALEKVYSIWICRRNVPKKYWNTLSVYEFANTWNNKNITPKKESYDLMSMVVIRLGNPEEDTQEDVFRILNALLYPRNDKSYEVLREYVDFSEALNKEVKKMMGLGEIVFFEGMEEGMEKGMEKGMEHGLERGKLEAAIALISKEHFSMERASQIIGIPVEQIREYERARENPL